MIQLNHGKAQNLQYIANAAFLASVFADYLNETGVPGWYCGSNFMPISVLKDFATSQVTPPCKMSTILVYPIMICFFVHFTKYNLVIQKGIILNY